MIAQVLAALAAPEIETARLAARRAGRRAALVALALLPIAVGGAFLLLALFLWLAERMAPWQAALLVGVLGLLKGLVLLLAARLAGRAPAAPARASAPQAVVTAALAAGIVLGRLLAK